MTYTEEQIKDYIDIRDMIYRITMLQSSNNFIKNITDLIETAERLQDKHTDIELTLAHPCLMRMIERDIMMSKDR